MLDVCLCVWFIADLGRFEPNFSLGFQLRTVQSIAVLFYIFSRRRTDAFVVQLTDGKVHVHTIIHYDAPRIPRGSTIYHTQSILENSDYLIFVS